MYLQSSFFTWYVTFINSIVMCMSVIFQGELYVPYVCTKNDEFQDGKYSTCLISNFHWKD